MNPMEPQPGEVPADIQKQMPNPRGNAPDENPEGSPTDILGQLLMPLSEVAKAVQGSSLPKEAQMHIQNAVSEYSAGLKMISEALGVPMPDVAGQQAQLGNQPEAVSGKSGAVPADQAVGGKGIRAIPA